MDADTKPTRNRARAREQGRFLSRKRGFMKKAHELHSKCDAEVYVVIRHNLRFYTYKASPMTDWPPAQRSIDEYYPLPELNTPETFAEKGNKMSGVADKKKTGSGSDKAQEAEQEVEQEVEQNEGQHDMEISRTEETD